MQQVASNSLSVTVIACGQIPGGTTLVYAIKVAQPVQIWTVVRSHDEFVSLHKIITSTIFDLPLLPLITMDAASNIVDIRASAMSIHIWLSKIMTRPGVANHEEMINFLTIGFNSIAPEYNNLPWVQFDTEPARTHYVAPHHTKVDDMEMEDMFADSHVGSECESNDDDYYDDDDDEEDIPSASVRHRPTNEDITNEDEMDLTGEVEMIDDIGSLAQSLGASHLGRSLQRQAEMGLFGMNNKLPTENDSPSVGLHIGGVPRKPNNATGGIGSALENAVNPAQQAASAPPMPRLDSFKMIKVIGKGSFGEYPQWQRDFLPLLTENNRQSLSGS